MRMMTESEPTARLNPFSGPASLPGPGPVRGSGLTPSLRRPGPAASGAAAPAPGRRPWHRTAALSQSADLQCRSPITVFPWHWQCTVPTGPGIRRAARHMTKVPDISGGEKPVFILIRPFQFFFAWTGFRRVLHFRTC